ncbi:biotin synthase BioB [Acidobacteria bacterium AH-259-O06]|nr:biotin synthase BioB [Acidobacteria bacterium AH-259-G07]MDA2930206.1 biotin synthase BioB [Acidobacteria bacterium AH-259-O06]
MQTSAGSRPLIRHDWMDAEIREIHDLPLPDLLFRAQQVHRRYHDPRKVQLCTLLSIKTAGCPEDCAYCPQSAHYITPVVPQGLLDVEQVLTAARQARDSGSTRFCMGAAWREAPDGRQFGQVLEMVTRVRELGMEACCTLGMLTREQAFRLAEAGLTAYNHNLDTGPDYYGEIITTRTYQDRLRTLQYVREAGITVCCGGILGMGESLQDRAALLRVLSSLDPHPESVPINALVRVKGTPLADRPPVDPIEMTRMIAAARIVLPKSRVRLSAGRTEMSAETQALCFIAGANSIFTGEKLLTTPNPGRDQDRSLLHKLGLSPLGLP